MGVSKKTRFLKNMFFFFEIGFFIESDYPSQNAEKRIPKNRLRKKTNLKTVTFQGFEISLFFLETGLFFLRLVFFSGGDFSGTGFWSFPKDNRI